MKSWFPSLIRRWSQHIFPPFYWPWWELSPSSRKVVWVIMPLASLKVISGSKLFLFCLLGITENKSKDWREVRKREGQENGAKEGERLKWKREKDKNKAKNQERFMAARSVCNCLFQPRGLPASVRPVGGGVSLSGATCLLLWVQAPSPHSLSLTLLDVSHCLLISETKDFTAQTQHTLQNKVQKLPMQSWAWREM